MNKKYKVIAKSNIFKNQIKEVEVLACNSINAESKADEKFKSYFVPPNYSILSITEIK